MHLRLIWLIQTKMSKVYRLEIFLGEQHCDCVLPPEFCLHNEVAFIHQEAVGEWINSYSSKKESVVFGIEQMRHQQLIK